MMTRGPASAFACSIIGGVITLISSILLINSWRFMYSSSGTTFNYSLWYFFGSVDFTATEALILFVIGAVCGVLIIFGAVLQHSGQNAKVKNGSIIVLLATIVGVPSTYFGMLIGGILSLVGAYTGLTWRQGSGPKTSPESATGKVP